MGVNPTYSADGVLSGGRLVRAVPNAADNADIPSLVELWAQDLRFAAGEVAALNGKLGDRLGGRLQLARTGYFGHSVGGAAAALVCRDDEHCAGAIDMDGDLAGDVLRSGVAKPFTFLAHDNSFDEEPYLRGEVHNALRGVPAGAGYVLRVTGTGHRSFTDRALTFSLVVGILRANGSIAPERGVRITRALLVGFFDQYLLEQPGSFTKTISVYPELVNESV